MGELFGTDGVRGVANDDLDGELAFALARAGAAYLTRQVAAGAADRPRLLVARDTRHSGPFLEAAVTAGLASAGVDAVRLGILPTSGLALTVARGPAAGGVMISASHNPAEYNGIKFLDAQGYKLSDAAEAAIEALLNTSQLPRPQREAIGGITVDDGAVDRYVDALLATTAVRLDGLRLVLDCAYGAAYSVAPRLFQAAGATLHCLHAEPDGSQINAGCGSTEPQRLQEAVRRRQADAGLAFDGDADRVIGVDETGAVVDGDGIMAIMAREALAADRLPGRTLVATVMSNLGLDRAVAELDGRVERTQVGDRYVLVAMLKGGYRLGGEQSGHIIFLDHTSTGDGLLTGFQLLATVARRGEPLSRLAACFEPYPQRLFNIRVPDKAAFSQDESLAKEMVQAEAALAGGRLLVRPSGTEPVIRVMVEGPDAGALDRIGRGLSERIAAALNGRVES